MEPNVKPLDLIHAGVAAFLQTLDGLPYAERQTRINAFTKRVEALTESLESIGSAFGHAFYVDAVHNLEREIYAGEVTAQTTSRENVDAQEFREFLLTHGLVDLPIRTQAVVAIYHLGPRTASEIARAIYGARYTTKAANTVRAALFSFKKLGSLTTTKDHKYEFANREARDRFQQRYKPLQENAG